MKNSCRTFSPAVVAGALALLIAAPQAASAQVVNGGYLRSGVVGRPGLPMPAPSQSPQAFMPMRSGTVYERPGGAFAPSSVYGQPSFNQPSFNPPVYDPPRFNGQGYGPPVYNNAPGYNPGYNNGPPYNNEPSYNSGPVYGNAPAFRSERQFGPAVNVPDPYEGAPGGGYRALRPGRFGGAAGGGADQSVYPTGARSGYSNPQGSRFLRPVGPAYGYSGGGRSGGTDLRITTPQGSQFVPPAVYHNNYIYNNYNVNRSTTIVNSPPLLGGYYYGSYCDTYVQVGTYPSVYSAYDGLPPYIYNPAANIITVGQPTVVQYVTPYLPFDTPNYTVTYNQNNYYVANEGRVSQIEGGGVLAREAIKNAYPADSYQAAFADIARAWTGGDIAPLRKHIRDADTRVSVFLNKKYSYSIASGDFAQITRDALDRLHTVSFDLTRLRKSKSGDVTAYGTHVYRTGDGAGSADTATVPFDQNGADPNAAGDTSQQASPYDKSADPAAGTQKTVYVSYTLRHRDGQWYIIEVGSSDHDLIPTQ